MQVEADHTGPDKPEGGRPPSSDFTKPLNLDDSRANQRLHGTPIPPRQPCFTSSSNLGVFMETNEGMSSKGSSFDRGPKSAPQIVFLSEVVCYDKSRRGGSSFVPGTRSVSPPQHHRSKRALAQVGVGHKDPSRLQLKPSCTPSKKRSGLKQHKLI